MKSGTAQGTAKSVTQQPVVGTAGGLRTLDGGRDGVLDGVPISAVHDDGVAHWVLARRRDLYRVADGATELVASLPAGASGTCVASHGGSIWVGGDNAGLWRLDGERLAAIEAFQEAPSHDDWHTPWGGPPAVFSMPSDGTDLYVSVHVGGILRTVDGSSWTPTIDLHDDVHQVAVGADGTVWAATGMRGLAESRDRGATWQYHTSGLHATYLLAVAATSDGALVGASSGHAGRDGRLYRFDGTGFSSCKGLPDDLGGAVAPRHLAADGDHAVVALPNGDVYTSDDAGRAWNRAMRDVPDVGEVTLSQP